MLSDAYISLDGPSAFIGSPGNPVETNTHTPRPLHVSRSRTRVLVVCVVCLTLALPGVSAAREGEGSSGAPSPSGNLQGRITVGPQLMSRKVRFTLYPDVSLSHPPPSPALADETRNVVVYLEGSAPSVSESGRPGTYRMEQRDEGFDPHVLPVPVGATVDFPNSDPIFHNVFSLSRVASFDLGRYPRGSSRSVRFDRPGVVKVFCHIHSDMSGVILVLDNALFATPGSDGGYEISGIPPGSYAVVAWHERARPIRRKIVVLPGRTAQADFDIPLQDSPVEP
jgi:plastocyanin